MIKYKKNISEKKLLLIIIIVATLLRIFALNLHDFWFDEAFSYFLASNPLPKILQAVLSDNNPPLYYLIIHAILRFSSNEIILRLPSVIFNLITIILIFSLFPKAEKKTAIIAAGLFAFSPLSVYIATEARLHSMATMLMLATTLSFIKFFKNPIAKNSITLAILSTLSLYTQYYSILLFPAFFLILYKKKNLKILSKFLYLSLITFLLFIPWIISSLSKTHTTCSCPHTLLSLPSALVSPSLGGIGAVTLRFFPQLSPPIFVLFLITSLLTLILFLVGITSNPQLSAFYFIPLLVLSIAGLLFPVFSPKAFVVFSPYFFAIVACGISKFKKNIINLSIILSTSLMLITITQIKYPFFHGESLKSFYQIINNIDPDSPVAHTSLVTFYSLNFYSQNQQKHLVLTNNPLPHNTIKFIGGEKQTPDPNLAKLWLADSPKWVPQPEYKNLITNLKKDYQFNHIVTKDNITLWYLEK